MFQGTTNTFGLDISDRALRLVQLKRSGKKIVLTSFGETTLDAGLFNAGAIVDEASIAAAIKKLTKSVAGGRIRTLNVISVLPEAKTFIKEIAVVASNIGDAKDNGLGQIIEREIVNHVPMAIEEIYLDWQLLHRDGDKAHVLIGATPRMVADSYVSLLEKAGLTPYALEIEAQAMVRALFPLNGAVTGATIVIDFGAIRTGLVIYDNESVQFTVSLPISGNNVTDTISKTLQLEPEKAEEAKIICGLDPEKCEGALLKILTNSITDLAEHIKRSIAFYKDNFPEGQPVSQIILCGGGANFLQIDTVLSSILGIPVTRGNPLTNISPGKLSIESGKLLSFTTAIGLALRGVAGKEIV